MRSAIAKSASIESRTPKAFLAKLLEIPGIGAWTAQYIAMRALREPDAFPTGDIALVRALQVNNTRELELRAEMWRPWRAYAAMYLWNVRVGAGIEEWKRASPAARNTRREQESVAYEVAAKTEGRSGERSAGVLRIACLC